MGAAPLLCAPVLDYRPDRRVGDEDESAAKLICDSKPQPLWLVEAVELQRQVDAQHEDSDDNYSYDDDEDDHGERLKEIAAAPASKGFDAEWHGLLSRLGAEPSEKNFGIDPAVIRYEFEAMDTNGDGSLDFEELAAVFSNLGITVRPYKLANLMKLADEDGNGTIEWAEFEKIVKLGSQWQSALQIVGSSLSSTRGPVLEYRLKAEFQKIDVDGNGSLDASEVMQLFKALEIPIDQQIVHQLITMADRDENGTVEWDEFRKMFHVINTVAKITQPQKSRKPQGDQKLKSEASRARQSSVEWQKILSEVGRQIKKSNARVDDKSLRREFDRIDTSGDGSLDALELENAFHRMGVNLSMEKVNNLVAFADEDGNSTIEWPEFKAMFDMGVRWHEFMMKLGKAIGGAGPLNDTVLRRQFCMIDKDGNGSLDHDELRQVFANLHIDIDDSTLQKLILLADGDGNEAIEWPEFRRMFAVVESVANVHEKKDKEGDLFSPRGSKSKLGDLVSPRGSKPKTSKPKPTDASSRTKQGTVLSPRGAEAPSSPRKSLSPGKALPT